MGISEEKQKQLFKVFEDIKQMASMQKQGIKSVEQEESKTSGYGLGLFLSLNLVTYL